MLFQQFIKFKLHSSANYQIDQTILKINNLKSIDSTNKEYKWAFQYSGHAIKSYEEIVTQLKILRLIF